MRILKWEKQYPFLDLLSIYILVVRLISCPVEMYLNWYTTVFVNDKCDKSHQQVLRKRCVKVCQVMLALQTHCTVDFSWLIPGRPSHWQLPSHIWRCDWTQCVSLNDTGESPAPWSHKILTANFQLTLDHVLSALVDGFAHVDAAVERTRLADLERKHTLLAEHAVLGLIGEVHLILIPGDFGLGKKMDGEQTHMFYQWKCLGAEITTKGIR